MDVKIKGMVISSTVAFVKQKFGEEKFDEIVRELPEEKRRLFTGPILAGATYNMMPFLEFQRKVCEILAKNDTAFAREIGGFAAERAFKGLFKYLLKLASIPFALKRAPFIYKTFYHIGKMELIKIDSEKKECTLKIVEMPFKDIFWEERIAGWIEKAGELLGAKSADVKILKSFAHGDEFIEYFIRWE